MTALLREELNLPFIPPDPREKRGPGLSVCLPELRKTPVCFLHSYTSVSSCTCSSPPGRLSFTSTCETRCQMMTATHPLAWTVAAAAWTWPMAALTPCPAARLRASVLQGACQQAPPALVSVTFASSATS